MEKIYIVSIVFAQKVQQLGLKNGSSDTYDIQNTVGVTRAESADLAYTKVLRSERLKFPNHKIVCQVVIETNEIDLNISES